MYNCSVTIKGILGYFFDFVDDKAYFDFFGLVGESFLGIFAWNFL